MKDLADLSGVSESAIGMYETGKRKPSFEVLLRLSEALGCTVDELVREKEKNQSEQDELADMLRILKDREDLRALLDVSSRNTPEQVRKLTALMESMNEGQQ